MAKYLVLYTDDPAVAVQMANARPEQLQASREGWMAWRESATKVATLEATSALKSVGIVTSEGILDNQHGATGFSIVEAESKAALLENFKSHPHMATPHATIEVLEMIPMPGRN
jgi:hypothetical protein